MKEILIVGKMMLKTLTENCDGFERYSNVFESDTEPYLAGTLYNFKVVCVPKAAPETIHMLQKGDTTLDSLITI